LPHLLTNLDPTHPLIAEARQLEAGSPAPAGSPE